MQVKTSIKAGGFGWGNHAETVVVKTGIKAGLWGNHSETLVVKTAVKAGGMGGQHAQTIVVKPNAKSGYRELNHNRT